MCFCITQLLVLALDTATVLISLDDSLGRLHINSLSSFSGPFDAIETDHPGCEQQPHRQD